MADDARAQFKLSYELSPIILNGGIAANLPGGMVPIISLTQAQDFSGGLLGTANIGPDDFVAHFFPLPGTTLEEIDVGKYGFANQQVAANAVIFKPIHVSLKMVGPAPADGGYTQKRAALTSLKQQLDQHILQGGTFTVATPSYLYTDCLLIGLRDVSGGDDSMQAQVVWQWDFEQPLLTLAAAAAAQNSLTSKISNGTQVTGDPPSYSGTGPSVGQPASGVAPPLVPAAQNPAGSSVSGIGQVSSVGVEPPI